MVGTPKHMSACFREPQHGLWSPVGTGFSVKRHCSDGISNYEVFSARRTVLSLQRFPAVTAPDKGLKIPQGTPNRRVLRAL